MSTRTIQQPQFPQGEGSVLRLDLPRSGRRIEIAAFSGDGSRLLTVQEVGIARVWDTVTGGLVCEIRPTSPLEGSEAWLPASPFRVFIEAAALSPAGSLALLGLNDGTAGVFSAADGRRLSILHAPDEPPGRKWSPIRAVQYSMDGTLAVAGFPGRAVGIWGRVGGARKAFLKPAAGLPSPDEGSSHTWVTSVAISPDNRYLCAGYQDGTAMVWDLLSEELVFRAADPCAPGCFLLQAPGGPYPPVSAEGPRGWGAPLPLSPDRRVMIVPEPPYGAALLTVEDPPRRLARMPFTGTLRAGCILSDAVLLVNGRGRLFRHRPRRTGHPAEPSPINHPD
jgi:WD40 repeat protein